MEQEESIGDELPVGGVLEDASGRLVLDAGTSMGRQREAQSERVRLQTLQFQFGVERHRAVGRHVDVVAAGRRRVASRRRRR